MKRSVVSVAPFPAPSIIVLKHTTRVQLLLGVSVSGRPFARAKDPISREGATKKEPHRTRLSKVQFDTNA